MLYATCTGHTRATNPRFTGTQAAAFQQLGGAVPWTTLQDFSQPENLLENSQRRLIFLKELCEKDGVLRKYQGYATWVSNLGIFFTHFFDGHTPHVYQDSFNRHGLAASPFRGSEPNFSGAIRNATGARDAVLMKTLGFIFGLGASGRPFDLKHWAAYGKDPIKIRSGEQLAVKDWYSARRFVALAQDVDMYDNALVFMHDPVNPRHLIKRSGKFTIPPHISQRLRCLPEVTSMVKQMSVAPDDTELGGSEEWKAGLTADPHAATLNDPYYIAAQMQIGDQENGFRFRPVDSIIMGSNYNEAMGYWAALFAHAFRIPPGNLPGIGRVNKRTRVAAMQFANYCVRPQILLPGWVELTRKPLTRTERGPWNWILEKINLDGKERFLRKELLRFHAPALLTYFYKLQSNSRFFRMGRGREDGRLAPPDRFSSRFPNLEFHSRCGYRQFGWPYTKFHGQDKKISYLDELFSFLVHDGEKLDTSRRHYLKTYVGLAEIAAACDALGSRLNLPHGRGGPTTVFHPNVEFYPRPVGFNHWKGRVMLD
ncbi:MAG: hypothetical protein GY710_12665 [Desulfobacteraceae bacterium]|nr:hypothetical protein [Desulfobacteraceae bacterium]